MANEATTIGARLRQARLNKNISLDELQQITKIQKRYLEAIESGKLDALPGSFYVRAFVKQYAQAVGEDGDKLVAILDGKASLTPPVPKRAQPETVQGSRKSLHVEEKTGNPIMRLLPVIFFGLVALVIVVIVFYMTWQDRSNQTPMIADNSSVVVNQASTASSSKAAASSTKESETKPAESTKESEKKEKEMAVKLDSNTQSEAVFSLTDAKGPIKLDFAGNANGPCWIGVLVNNGYVYQYTLQAGETQSTTLPEGAANATIVLGASGNLNIKANGKDLNYTDPNIPALRKNITLTINYQTAE
ncbi:transcriptional regulator [Enterococcus saigonensis]|uniref:Transcriptional regulator n=1 Tax=Enterococcus saigonensis TaxID=1805431 RepID=A0A679I566_9ENTE|nr:helix-turn-helix domain-containing protein [Enterococcus saigonensis]BCA84638.1 transcriptional regulator [Enterococcus saigonensis]